jgi:hypothetical protein
MRRKGFHEHVLEVFEAIILRWVAAGTIADHRRPLEVFMGFFEDE